MIRSVFQGLCYCRYLQRGRVPCMFLWWVKDLRHQTHRQTQYCGTWTAPSPCWGLPCSCHPDCVQKTYSTYNSPNEYREAAGDHWEVDCQCLILEYLSLFWAQLLGVLPCESKWALCLRWVLPFSSSFLSTSVSQPWRRQSLSQVWHHFTNHFHWLKYFGKNLFILTYNVILSAKTCRLFKICYLQYALQD